MNNEQFLTLSQLGGLVKGALSVLDEELWVAAEIARLNYHPSSGHCYLELVEKSEDKVIAQMKGTIWARVFGPLHANFQALTAAAQTAARGKRRTGLRQRWQTGGVERVEVI